MDSPGPSGRQQAQNELEHWLKHGLQGGQRILRDLQKWWTRETATTLQGPWAPALAVSPVPA
jgi:hypothetical protein